MMMCRQPIFTQTAAMIQLIQSQFAGVHLKLLQGALLAHGLHKRIHGLPLTLLNTPQLPHSCACMDLLPLCLGAIILYGLQHGTTLKMVFMAILPLGREL
jgi:hypothetical protein